MSIEHQNRIAELERRVAALEAALKRLMEEKPQTLTLPEKRKSA